MLCNLLLIRPFCRKSDKSSPSKSQPEKNLNEQGHSPAQRHHHDALESLRQFKQRYYLERKVF